MSYRTPKEGADQMAGKRSRGRLQLGPDKVSSLKQDSSRIETHSVPIGIDAFAYAKRMAERETATTPAKFFLIEVNGTRQKISREDLVGKKTA
jgi:hypothetical protein